VIGASSEGVGPALAFAAGEGIRIDLTPVQRAAGLAGEAIDEQDALSNRLLGRGEVDWYAKSLAWVMGDAPSTAEMIGLGADVAIALVAGGVGAFHVFEALRSAINLRAQSRISAASTFQTLVEAERHVSAALRSHRAAIEAWARTATMGSRPCHDHRPGERLGGRARGEDDGPVPADDPARRRAGPCPAAGSCPLRAHVVSDSWIMPVIFSKGQQRFPELAAFLGGWFHQDFDIRADSLEEVMAAFRSESDLALVQPLVDDIDAFLATGEEGMEERF
jgi:CdiI immunity protein